MLQPRLAPYLGVIFEGKEYPSSSIENRSAHARGTGLCWAHSNNRSNAATAR